MRVRLGLGACLNRVRERLEEGCQPMRHPRTGHPHRHGSSWWLRSRALQHLSLKLQLPDGGLGGGGIGLHLGDARFRDLRETPGKGSGHRPAQKKARRLRGHRFGLALGCHCGLGFQQLRLQPLIFLRPSAAATNVSW